MFQDYALFPHMTVAENVMFGLAALAPAERRKVAGDMLERVGLAAFGDTFPHLISGGEQQRVALARALAPRPHVILMDEPFSNLDRATRDLVREETVSLLRQAGAAAIFVTHDPEDAVRVADRIVMLRAGRVIQTGTPDELFRRPASLFVARFFAEFNEIEGTVREGRIETPLGSFAVAGLVDGTHAIVCIRPNHISIRDDAGGRGGGIVAGMRHLGDSILSTIAIEGLARPMQVRGASRYAPGSRVSIDFSPADALIFPSAEEGAGSRQ
jgi:iron(III) transport system ATP-binding protein